eukprot:g2042.t1
MSSSAAKKNEGHVSASKKDTASKEDSIITSPRRRLNVKKRRTTETESLPIPENHLKEAELAKSESTTFQVKLLSEHAITPVRKTEFSAGYDIASAKEYVVPAGGRVLVQTDIAIAIPQGCYGRIAPRSGLAVNYGIETGAGVIDSDYRGALGVLLFNHSDADYKVKKGDRVAQLILERIEIPEVQVVKELAETKRGDSGFGSTGVGADSTNVHDED